MDAATISKLDQPTIGADDLRSFIEVLDDIPGSSPDISHITADLRVALGKWHRSIAYNTGLESIDRLPHRSNDSYLDRAELNAALQKIELHLSRLVNRHSNYAFGASNVPSELDHFFPQTALNEVRVARVHLRKVLSDFARAQAPRLASVTVTKPVLSVCAW